MTPSPSRSPASPGSGLPNGPGVYLFYGLQEELLYVGKSKTVRARVRAHAAARDERRMMKRVRRVEVRETAGELGALLLESQLIKELKPWYNVRSRQRRRIIVARKRMNKAGYALVLLEAVDYFSLKPDSPVLGLFKTRSQAREFLEAAARKYRLCPKLLRLETPSRYCFAYHLGRCDGACMGEEDPGIYNARLEEAFDARRIIAWPFTGPIAIEESFRITGRRERFILDNWCLLGSLRDEGSDVTSHVSSDRRFDYDSYRLLYVFVTMPPPGTIVRPALPEECVLLSGIPASSPLRPIRPKQASHILPTKVGSP